MAGEEQSEIEKALRKSEERFRRVVEAAPNGMVMVDQDGRIEMVNTQAERMFGYQRAEMLGQPVEMLVPDRFRGQHPGMRKMFFSAPQARPMGAGRDLYARRADGSEFPVEIGLNPIETEDGPMVLSAIVDISDRKQKEDRIQAALEEKSVLLAEIHHRVKNNLQIIHSLLDLQASRIGDPGVVELLRDSQNRIRSMAMIHQTLYQSHDFAQVDFGAFLETLAPTLMDSYDIERERIDLVLDTAALSLPLSVAIPCGLIVNELIANALKHAFPGGRRGEVRIRLSAETESSATLSVCDNGKGLPANLDPLGSGTLGLQLVTVLTGQLGGRLSVDTGGPTCFSLEFPLEEGESG